MLTAWRDCASVTPIRCSLTRVNKKANSRLQGGRTDTGRWTSTVLCLLLFRLHYSVSMQWTPVCWQYCHFAPRVACVVCILCDFCSCRAPQYECACHGHFPNSSVLSKLCFCSLRWKTFDAARIYCCGQHVYFQCVQIYVCGIHRQPNTDQTAFSGELSVYFSLFRGSDQKYVSARLSVKANWQPGINYKLFISSNKNISISVHNCIFEGINVKGKTLFPMTITWWEAQLSHQLFDQSTHPILRSLVKTRESPMDESFEESDSWSAHRNWTWEGFSFLPRCCGFCF